MKLQVLTWTPSRYAKWKECAAKVLYEDLMKMCPVCYKGHISGGYDGDPVVCDSCDKDQPARDALDRGNRLDDALTAHVARVGIAGPKVEAHKESFEEATRHPVIEKMVKRLRKAKGVTAQANIVLDRGWTLSAKGKFTKNAWARLKLDVLELTAKVAKIIDWKSGNIDKSKGIIRERAEYHDSMRAYQIAVLSAYPQAEATATMVFLDAPPKLENPTKAVEPLKRKDLAAAQKDWEKKIEPMFNDTTFAPRPGMYCNWCPFSKDKGGPCKFSGREP